MRGCPIIVGRDTESNRLQAALAVDSGVTLVSVTGEAGIGKSRLVADMVGNCEDDNFVVRRCGCYLADQGLPFGPFLDLASSADELAALGSALTAAAGATHAEGPHAELERRRVFDEICSTVRAADCRTIVIVEDVHWADDVSLDALGHLARRMAGSDDRLVITHRPAEEPAGLTAVLTEVSRQRTIEEIELQPLDEAGVATMAAAMTGADLDGMQRASLAEISDGNPFYIEELLRSKNGEFDGTDALIPRPVGNRVLTRLAELDEASQRAANRAAVIGRDVSIEQLAGVMGWDARDTARHASILVEAGLLRDVDGNRLRFVHELARRVVESQLLAMERVAVHREIADFLSAQIVTTGEGWSGDERVRADLARHAYEGQDWQTAVEHGTIAARAALRRWSARAAAANLDRVVDAAARGGVELPADVYVMRANARRELGELGDARDDLVLATSRADASGDTPTAWEARYELAMLEGQRSHERASEGLDEALRLARSWGDPTAIARTLNRQGNLAANRFEMDAAIDLLDEAMELAIGAGADEVAGESGTLLVVTHALRGDPASAQRAGEEAVAALRRVDDPVGIINALFSLAILGGEHSYLERSHLPVHLGVCADEAEDAVRLAHNIGWTAGQALSNRALGSVRSAQGRAGEAVTRMRESIRLAESIGHATHIMRGHIMMGDVLLDLGDTVGARHHFEHGLEFATQVGAAAAALPARCRLVELDLAEGRINDAAERLDALRGDGNSGILFRMATVATAEVLLARAEPESALRIVTEAVPGLPGITLDDLPPRLALLVGRALADLGRLDESASALLAADLHARALGMRQMLRVIVAARARVAAKQGDRELARSLCDEVWTMTAEFSRDLESDLAELLRADSERRTSSVPRTAAVAPGAAGGLTPRETEVAVVLARGLTNQQIAEELFISVRTAETHVKRILSKLGLSSRGQVARWVYDHKLLDG